DIVTNLIETLFTGYTIESSFLFRVTRNADLDIQEDGADDLLTVIEDYLVERRNGMAVRIEIQQEENYDQEYIHADLEYLLEELGLLERDLYFVNGPLDLTGLRSEEHTSELQSRFELVCRLLLEKKNSTPMTLSC